MTVNKDLKVQSALSTIQVSIVKLGSILIAAVFIFEIALKHNINKNTVLNISLIGTVIMTTILIITVLIIGIGQDKSQTRADLLKSSDKNIMYKYMAAKVYHVSYRTKAIGYSILTIVVLAVLTLSLVYQEYLFFTIPTTLSVLFLSALSGIAKYANKVSTISYKYVKELEVEAIDLAVAQREQDEK